MSGGGGDDLHIRPWRGRHHKRRENEACGAAASHRRRISVALQRHFTSATWSSSWMAQIEIFCVFFWPFLRALGRVAGLVDTIPPSTPGSGKVGVGGGSHKSDGPVWAKRPTDASADPEVNGWAGRCGRWTGSWRRRWMLC